jgi:spore coat protein A, manganese oxidase
MSSRIPQPKMNLSALRWRTKLEVPQKVDLNGTTELKPQRVYIGQKIDHVFYDDDTGTGKIIGSIWGYGLIDSAISSPGPTFTATANKAVYVQWKNNHKPSLEDPLRGIHHPFVEPPRELRSPGMMSRYDVGHAVVHLHGAHVPWTSDGYPMRVSDGMKTGTLPVKKTVLRPGESEVFEYPNTQPGGATLWYHDHTMDMTSMNVYAGLAGAYLLRHEKEESLASFPKGAYEIPLIIQDRSFTEDGKFLYGDADFLTQYLGIVDGKPDPDPEHKVRQKFRNDFFSGTGTQPSPEFKGQVICVNGKIWPYLEVEPRPYRFRIVNGSNSRMYVLRLSNPKSTVEPESSEPNIDEPNPKMDIYQIGADGGIFEKAVCLSGDSTAEVNPANFLVLASGERADIIIDFSALAGKMVYLTNHATENSPLGNGGDDPTQLYPSTNGILKFHVKQNSPVPIDLNALNFDLKLIARTQDLNLEKKDGNAKIVPARRYLIEEFGPNPLTPESLNKIIHGGAPRGWKAITFQPDITVDPKTERGYLWGGTAPTYGSVPNGNPRPIQEPNPNDFLKIPPLSPDRIGNADPHQLGRVELWEFYNNSLDVHPIHLHHSSVRIHSRVPLSYSFRDMAPAQPIPPDQHDLLDGLNDNERGWKDTVRVNPGQLTRILVRFDNGGDTMRPDDYYKGHYVWHCHILEHEDMGMMRPLIIE